METKTQTVLEAAPPLDHAVKIGAGEFTDAMLAPLVSAKELAQAAPEIGPATVAVENAGDLGVCE